MTTEATTLRIRRLELDLVDLRAENWRLKLSAAQKEEEWNRYHSLVELLEKRLKLVRWMPGLRLVGRKPVSSETN